MNRRNCPPLPRLFDVGRRMAASASVVAAAALCWGCATSSESNRDVRVMPDGSRRGPPVSQVELQQDIQRFTSDFMSRLAEAGERMYQESGPREREIALRRVLVYASNALDISTGPFPEINLADMVVFVSLCRDAYDRHWRPHVFGDNGQPLADTFAQAERQVWAMSSKILSKSQQVQFETLIAEWQRAHPERHSVEGVRFQQFSSRAAAVSAERAGRARGLFGQIKSATQSADQALLIAERAMFITQRMPFLIRVHARLALQEGLHDSLDRLSGMEELMAQVPATQPMLKDLVAVSNNAASAARETRLLVESSEPYLAYLVGDERQGVRGTDEEDAHSLRDALVRLEAISERALALVREVRASVPQDPQATMVVVEQRIEGMARRIALYGLIVGIAWAAVFWSGYYLVKRATRTWRV
jgi:hypothetical protein